MRIMDETSLRGQQVAFTGRMATMTRSEAAALVASFGGQFSPLVTRNTAYLVVGQEGLPLTKRGGLTNKLRKARQLGAGRPMILGEQEFFDRLGLSTASADVHRLYSMAQLCRLLRLPRDRLRAWQRAGLIGPVETVHGVGFFDFQKVTGVKTLCDLTQAGVKPPQIRRSLELLGRWLPGIGEPLAQLALLERDGKLLVRLEHGQLAEPTGQMHLDFAAEESSSAITELPPPLTGVHSAEDWWDRGLDAEEAGRLDDAARAYREALYASGPDAMLCFNLGNVLFALGQHGQAAERFRQAIELDHDFAAAWNNLGNTLVELNELDEALAAFRKALAIAPECADAHYNLADTLEQQGEYLEARSHWKAYVRFEPAGTWTDYARRRLAQACSS